MTIFPVNFANYLLEKKMINADVILHAQQQIESEPISFIYYLVKKEILAADIVAAAVSDYFSLPLFDLVQINLEKLSQNLLDLDLVQQRYALPISENEQEICFAVADPTIRGLDQLGFLLGLSISLVVVSLDSLEQAIEKFLNKQLVSSFASDVNHELEKVKVANFSAYHNTNLTEAVFADDAPVVNFIYKILIDAINRRASDIHFEPYEDQYRIRFRQDGILYEVANAPKKLAGHLVSRLKIMADLDIAEKRLPQDGRFKLTVFKNRAIDFRISICPVLFGEKIVLRILNNTGMLLDVEALGMNVAQQQIFLQCVKQSQGLILVTGPTGSGKTVTLYTALDLLNDSKKNISTVEDPVEIYLPGINQVAVNYKIGLDFSLVLCTFLRQDPDVMMVGEIRDLQTAEVAIKAAHTGHLVLSTVHTNSAADTLVRLANMGVAAFNLASAITLIIAQRLVRKLCDFCKQETNVPAKSLNKNIGEEHYKIYMAKGCEQCIDGYQGRVGIFEMIYVSDTMSRLIMAEAGALAIAAQAKQEGFLTLREIGLQKVIQGLTSLEEINRVL